MANPTTAITRHDLSLTYNEFNLEANRRGYIGLRVLPAVPVGLQSAQFDVIPLEAVMGPVEDTRRAPGGTYKRDDFEWDHDNYATEDHGVEEPVDDRQVKNYGSQRTDRIKSRRAVNRVLQRYEYDVASAVFNTTTWSGAALTTAVAIPWTTHGTALPIDNILGAVESVEASCGRTPNTLVVTKYALRHMIQTSQIVERVKYSGLDDPKNISLAALRELFQLEQILVANGFANSANRGQAATITRDWNVTRAMVCHVATDGDLESPDPCIGRTVMWTEENAPLLGDEDATPGVIIEQYREEPRRGSTIRGRCDYQIKIIHKEAGHLLTGVTA